MKIHDVGDAALQGWREKLADTVARRAPLREDQVRTALGLFFLGLSLRHLAVTARDLAARR